MAQNFCGKSLGELVKKRFHLFLSLNFAMFLEKSFFTCCCFGEKRC